WLQLGARPRGNLRGAGDRRTGRADRGHGVRNRGSRAVRLGVPLSFAKQLAEHQSGNPRGARKPVADGHDSANAADGQLQPAQASSCRPRRRRCGMTANAAVQEIAKREYEHGFVTPIESESAPKGLNEEIIRFISRKKNEPDFLLEWRLKSYRHWLKMQEPSW